MGASNEPLWSHERQQLHVQLASLSPGVAGMYRFLIRLLDTPSAAGDEAAARVALIAHCLREIINPLPDLLEEGAKSLITRAGRRADDIRLDFPDVVERYLQGRDPGIVRAELAPADSNEAIEELPSIEFVTVPPELVALAIELSEAVKEESATRAERDALLIAGKTSAVGPALKPWNHARRFFMKWVHIDRIIADGRERVLPTDELILEHLTAIENVLASRLLEFFDARRLIDDMLERFNRKTEDNQ
ncbi:hypothetical protein [Yonghaparkia sp. Root332]|uniref:hypothetical protein n=1 Tax=Yonghaparkia sp. Root332 TaxID=1736516 RepID=UPI0012E3AE6E|nr:hypothetical protein [Yonghaparkia sp. Root332]